MAALLEKVRNFHVHPAMSDEEREAEYGTYIPKVARASRASLQRNVPAQANSRYASAQADVQQDRPITDALADEEPAPSRPPLSRRNTGGTIPPRSDNQKVTYQRQANNGSVWKVIFGTVSAILTILFLIYTLAFLVVAGWIGISNAFLYGQTHTASTQTIINGQQTTVVTSNIKVSAVQSRIYVTIIADGVSKVYIGPTLEANAWGGDPNGVVATATVGSGPAPTITISLIGGVNYLRPFFIRPQTTFSLLPDKQTGYKFVQS